MPDHGTGWPLRGGKRTVAALTPSGPRYRTRWLTCSVAWRQLRSTWVDDPTVQYDVVNRDNPPSIPTSRFPLPALYHGPSASFDCFSGLWYLAVVPYRR